MQCVESVNYSVWVNHDFVGPIISGRGHRHPLSPFLFLICSEGLSGLTHQADNRGELHGIRICRGAPIGSHLLFTDDCF